VKHPNTVFAYSLIDVVHNIGHIKYGLLRSSILVGHVMYLTYENKLRFLLGIYCLLFWEDEEAKNKRHKQYYTDRERQLDDEEEISNHLKM
jgi:hypothetical protein